MGDRFVPSRRGMLAGGVNVNTFYYLQFDGSQTKYCDIADASAFHFNSGGVDQAFSYSWWQYTRALRTNDSIFSKWESSSREMWMLLNGSGALIFSLYNGASNAIHRNSANSTILPGSWKHICLTYDGSESENGIHWYVNGANVDAAASMSGTYTGMGTSTEKLRLGNYTGNTNYINADFDEITIYNVELTTTEISEIYNAGQKSNAMTFSTAPHLVAYWPFTNADSSADGGTCRDYIGTNNLICHNTVSGDLLPVP